MLSKHKVKKQLKRAKALKKKTNIIRNSKITNIIKLKAMFEAMAKKIEVPLESNGEATINPAEDNQSSGASTLSVSEQGTNDISQGNPEPT